MTIVNASLDVTDLITLKDALDPKRFVKALERAVHTMARTSLREYESTVSTWEHTVTFTAEENVNVDQAQAEYMIGTDDLIYKFVDLGTKPHTIRAKTPRGLIFRYPYTARTVPGKLGSGESEYGDNWARRMEVNHPGTQARGFTDLIYRHMQQSFEKIAMREIQSEWKKQVKSSRKK